MKNKKKISIIAICGVLLLIVCISVVMLQNRKNGKTTGAQKSVSELPEQMDRVTEGEKDTSNQAGNDADHSDAKSDGQKNSSDKNIATEEEQSDNNELPIMTDTDNTSSEKNNVAGNAQSSNQQNEGQDNSDETDSKQQTLPENTKEPEDTKEPDNSSGGKDDNTLEKDPYELPIIPVQ
ncbi:MAG: hypothetical protein PHS82_16170 [Lachnospiraceae bacterium]|nr:hypothetical protein [Lachnospiraceae bacterium]